MEKNIVISVITPFYKGNRFLKQLFDVVQKNYETLKSKYHHSAIELILINDSPEVEVEIPNCSVDFEFHIIRHEVNMGIHQARVTGLVQCSGEYILFLDQDDVLENNAVVNQVDFILGGENINIVVCNAYIEKSDGSLYTLYRKKADYRKINDLEFYLKSHNVIKSPGQCLIKKDSIPIEWEKYIMKKNGSDDLFLWILLLEKSYKLAVNSKPLYIHKYTGENLSDSEIKMGNSSLEIVEFLRRISYVPERDICDLKKAREFSLGIHSKSMMKKFKAIICNVGLIMYLIKNKLKVN